MGYAPDRDERRWLSDVFIDVHAGPSSGGAKKRPLSRNASAEDLAGRAGDASDDGAEPSAQRPRLCAIADEDEDGDMDNVSDEDAGSGEVCLYLVSFAPYQRLPGD